MQEDQNNPVYRFRSLKNPKVFKYGVHGQFDGFKFEGITFLCPGYTNPNAQNVYEGNDGDQFTYSLEKTY
jgi:hypothetical protein